MPNKNDLGRAMDDLKNWIFIKHNGVLIERSNGGFLVSERRFETLGEAYQFIDDRRKAFQELIKRQNTKQ